MQLDSGAQLCTRFLVINFLVIVLVAIFVIAPQTDAFARVSGDQQTLGEVQKILAKELGLDPADLKADTDLVKDLHQDSSEVYYAVLKLYKKLNIDYTNASFTKVGDIVRVAQRFSKKRRKFKTRSMVRGFNSPVATSAPSPAAGIPSSTTRGLSGPSVHDIESNKNAYEQTVFYATNRKETGNARLEDFYGGARSQRGKLTYGLAKVNIPKSHKPGQLEEKWNWLWGSNSEAHHIYIKDLDELTSKDFFSLTRSRPEWRGGGNDVLIYIHGFNVTFDEGVRRAAQIAFDFKFPGTAMAFTWPSDGISSAYASDREDASWAVKYFSEFIMKLHNDDRSRKIHVIAHSMGNQVLLNSLRDLSYAGKKKPVLSNVIMAAPDFDAGLFKEQIAAEVRHLAESWTVYASKNDYALWFSEKVNAAPRLGRPLTLAEGFSIIDASELQVTPWNVPESHTYYATKKVLLDDMIDVLKGLTPDKRKLTEIANGPMMFWRFK